MKRFQGCPRALKKYCFQTTKACFHTELQSYKAFTVVLVATYQDFISHLEITKSTGRKMLKLDLSLPKSILQSTSIFPFEQCLKASAFSSPFHDLPHP